MSNLKLTILGTASAMPVSYRNPSAQVLSVHGRLFLIDCGEGTQKQMRRSHIPFLKFEAVFISHIHGDHLFGLFGFLNSMAMYGRTAPLHVYGPHSLGPVLNFHRSFFSSPGDFEIVFHPVKTDGLMLVHESKYVNVSAFPLKHGIECYGYRFDEVLSVKAPQGTVPHSYAYCSDTAYFPELPEYVKNVDVLYHEATYMNEMSDKAVSRMHSTTAQAADCALKSGALRLLVGHYSSRITDFDAYIRECREVFPETTACNDGDIVEI